MNDEEARAEAARRYPPRRIGDDLAHVLQRQAFEDGAEWEASRKVEAPAGQREAILEIMNDVGLPGDPYFEAIADAILAAGYRKVEVTEDQWEWGVESGIDGHVFEFPTREQAEVYARAVSTRTWPDGRVEKFARQLVHRRKAGPWEPVAALGGDEDE